MGTTIRHGSPTLRLPDTQRLWPLDARTAMFVLEAGGDDSQVMRERSAERRSCRAHATVHRDLQDGSSDRTIYLRDLSHQCVGFISADALKPGEHIRFSFADAAELPGRFGTQIGGQVRRSREFMNGWFEGVIELEHPLMFWEKLEI